MQLEASISYYKVRKGTDIMLSTSEYSRSGNNIYYNPLLTDYNSYSENDAVFPIWKSKSIFHKEYLQVEVFADKEVPLGKSTDDVLNMSTYECYICNTDVPKSYMTEHNAGNKHKACLKIVDLAMERTRKHMHLNIKEPRLSIQVTESYFCEPCAIVVQRKDKLSHELSIKHVNSTKYDEILHMFLKIYEDKNNIDLVSNNEVIYDQIDKINQDEESPNENLELIVNIGDDKKSPTIEKTEKSSFVPEKNTITKTDQDSVQPEISTKDLLPTLKKVHKQSNSENSKKIRHRKPKAKKCTQSSQLADYLKTITEKCATDPIHTVEALTDKLILITAINGDKVKVPLSSFHSIHRQKERSYCKICEEPNADYNHEYSEEHMEKIMIPIEDKNAIRKIDDIWSHCVLCNDLTKNTVFHLQSLLHRNKLKHCLAHSETDINHNLLPNTAPTSNNKPRT